VNIERGDFTVGDEGVIFEITADITLTGLNIDFIFAKPSGATITRDATTIAGTVAQYVWATGDLDEAGEWHAWLYNATTTYTFRPKDTRFVVVPKPEDQAKG
jgi:hypothetical protein